MEDKQDELLAERGQQYADACILTGEVVRFITSSRNSLDVFERLILTGYFYNWITILCKLLRAISSPTNPDHWRDISGYALLVAEHLETGSRGRQ